MIKYEIGCFFTTGSISVSNLSFQPLALPEPRSATPLSSTFCEELQRVIDPPTTLRVRNKEYQGIDFPFFFRSDLLTSLYLISAYVTAPVLHLSLNWCVQCHTFRGAKQKQIQEEASKRLCRSSSNPSTLKCKMVLCVKPVYFGSEVCVCTS